MRIAITADPFIPVPPIHYGGIERIIHFLVEGLVKKGHEVILVAHPDSDVTVEKINFSNTSNQTINHFKNIYSIQKLKKWKPDVIHSFSRLTYLLPFLQTEVPKLMSYQREPTINQIKKAMKFAKKNTMNFSGCSDYISNKIKPYAPSYTVYNGVNLNQYNFKEFVDPDSPLIFLGRIEPIKGTHTAIEVAIATNKNLLIAGNIPAEYDGYFNEKIKPYLNDKIKYIGQVNDEQKNEILGSAAALLMPIDWEEPFGIVMIEAMACGTPVIGYKKGALTEVIEHNINGFLVNDFDDLTSHISKIDKISRKEVRYSVEQKYSSEKIINDYVSLYEKLIHDLPKN